MYSFGILYKFLPLDGQQLSGTLGVAEANPRATFLKADLHINYWELDDAISSKSQFLDFGLLIKKSAADVESLCFYLPFRIDSKNIEDLGAKLKSEQMISSLFNEDYNCESNMGTSYTTVREKGSKKIVFYLYELGTTNFEVESVNGFGSLLKVKMLSRPPVSGPASTECDVYVRFRLKGIPVAEIFYEEKISNDYIQSAFYKTKMLDFRVNERREMSNKLLEVLETEEQHFVEFDKFHFYYVGSSKKEKVEGNVSYTDCRLLDYSKWESYLPSISNKTKKFLCYHWKKREDGKSFSSCSVFMRTIFKSLNWKIISVYSIIAIALSFVASALWGLVAYWMFS